MFPHENLQFIPNKDEMRKTNPAAVKISTLVWQSRRHRRVRKHRHKRLCYSKTFDITAEKGRTWKSRGDNTAVSCCERFRFLESRAERGKGCESVSASRNVLLIGQMYEPVEEMLLL